MANRDHGDALTRRSLLGKAIGLGAVATLGVTALSAAPASAWELQHPWDYCRYCAALVNTSWFNQGCPADGGHWKIGWTFQLPYTASTIPTGTPNDQPDWRHCGRCETLYFDGYSWDGVCRGNNGGPHTHNGLYGGNNYILPHDLANTSGTQTNWRFCTKCNVLFYNGSSFKGVCAAGGAHNALGFDFDIPVYSY